MSSLGKYYDWVSWETPSYKSPIRIGGIYIVTEAVPTNLPYNMRIVGWKGMEEDPKKAPPSQELYDHTPIVRPENGLLIEKYDRYGTEYKISHIVPKRKLRDPEVSHNLKEVFNHAKVDYTPHEDMKNLVGLGLWGTSLFNFTFAEPEYEDFSLKISNEWHTIPGGYVTCKMMSKKPWAVFMHGTEPGRRGGISHYDNQVTVMPNTDGFFHGNRLLRDIETGIGIKHADVILTPSKIMVKEIEEFAKQHGVDATGKVFPIYHGVYTDEYKPQKIKKDGKELLYIGRLSRVKGIPPVVEVHRILREEFPDLKLKFLGSGELEGQLRNYVAQDGTGKIELDTDWKSVEQKVEEFCKADVVCLPSQYEPSGQTHFEASACGRPVAIGFGGWREHTVDGKTAIHIDPRDPKSFAEKIKPFLKDEKLAEEMGSNARDAMVKYYDWKKRINAYSHFVDVLNTGNKSLFKDLEEEFCPVPTEFM
jgi:glycosyltransferase involved in cell wall biosynthesis